MNKETAELIERLAAKLGTTAEHLWGVLIRQAPLSATLELAQMVGCFILAYVAVRLAWRLWEKAETDDCEGSAIAASIGAGVMVLLAVASFLACPETIVAGFFNPEYWALKQIIK